MIVPPFWSIPVRAPTLPLTMRSPPRIAAPVSEPAFFSITTTPDIMFSHDGPTDPAGHRDLRAVVQAEPEVAEGALEPDPAALEDPDTDRMLRARVRAP